MKKMKNRKGFTLVELIVVIAILAILAGIAIPVYSGYIKKANEAADMQQLDSVKTAAVFAVVAQNPNATVTKIVYDGTTIVTVQSSLPTGDTSTAPTSADISAYTSAYTFKGPTSSWTWTTADGWKPTTTGG